MVNSCVGINLKLSGVVLISFSDKHFLVIFHKKKKKALTLWLIGGSHMIENADHLEALSFGRFSPNSPPLRLDKVLSRQ